MSERTAVARCPQCGYPSSVDAAQPHGETLCVRCGSVFTPPSAEDLSGYETQADGPELEAEDAEAPLSLAPPPLPPSAAAAPTLWAQRIPSSSAFDVPGRRPSSRARGAAKTDKRPWIKVVGAGAVILIILVSVSLKVAKQFGIGGFGGPAARRTAPSTPPPPLAFHDEGGRRVGTAAVRSRRAAATDVRLVLPPGRHPNASLACVFVCPAGSNLLVGVPFGPGEREDFYPFLEAGIAVCFYTLDGTVNLESASEQQILAAIGPYRDSDSGIYNLSDAIDTVLAGAPEIDQGRLGTCGHSSAGTIAIMAADREPRIHAVAAMAPALDLPKRLEPVVSRADARFGQWVRSMSPSEIQKLPCAVWIYHARDDDNVPLADAERFAATHGSRVTLRIASSGGHVGAYDQGMPEAVAFLAKALNAR